MERSHVGSQKRKIGGYVKVEERIKYLLQLSEAKLVLMTNLLEATKEQREILSKEAEESLDASLQKRQVIMGKIDILDKEFLEKYNIVKKELGIENLEDFHGDLPAGFKELKAKAIEIMKKIEEIQSIDQSNQVKLKENMEKLQGDIRSLRNSKKAVSGYREYQGEMPSIFIDKKK